MKCVFLTSVLLRFAATTILPFIHASFLSHAFFVLLLSDILGIIYHLEKLLINFAQYIFLLSLLIFQSKSPS